MGISQTTKPASLGELEEAMSPVGGILGGGWDLAFVPKFAEFVCDFLSKGDEGIDRLRVSHCCRSCLDGDWSSGKTLRNGAVWSLRGNKRSYRAARRNNLGTLPQDKEQQSNHKRPWKFNNAEQSRR
jgi:hypothetical protein